MRQDHRALLTEYCGVLPLIRSIHARIVDPNTYNTVGNQTEEIDAAVKTLLLSTATGKQRLSLVGKKAVVAYKNEDPSLRPLEHLSEMPRVGIMKLLKMYYDPAIRMVTRDAEPRLEMAISCSDLHIAAINHVVKSVEILMGVLSTYSAELTRVNDHLCHIIGASASPSRPLSSWSSRRDHDALTSQLFTMFRSIRGNILDAHPLSPTELACVHYILSSYLTHPKASHHPHDGSGFGWYRIKDEQHDFYSMQTLCGLNEVDDVASTKLLHSEPTVYSAETTRGNGGSKERWARSGDGGWMEVAMDMHVDGPDDNQGEGKGEAKGKEPGVEFGKTNRRTNPRRNTEMMGN